MRANAWCRFPFVLGALLIASCKGSGTDPAPGPGRTASIELVSGDAQTGFGGEELADAVVVRVKDSSGAPVAGQIISFRVTEGGGSVFAGSALSDSTGTARERWTLGPAPGLVPAPQRLEARAVDPQTGAAIVFASFNASAVAHPPASIIYPRNPATYVGGAAAEPNAPTSTGGAVVVYEVSPALPAGLVLDAATGTISGTPMALASAPYTVTAKNSGGSASVALVIIVTAPDLPTIRSGPDPVRALVGGPATFAVVADGASPLTYQWIRNGASLAGATQASYSLPSVAFSDAGATFRVRVTDAFGRATTSSTAQLSVMGFSGTGSMDVARASHTATLLANGTVLVAGGYPPTATAETYDPTSGTFSPTGSMRVARDGHTATLLLANDVLVAGGAGGSNQTCELYDAATRSFSSTGSMRYGRGGHTATLLDDGKVLVVAGSSIGAELYSPTSGTFADTGSTSSWHGAFHVAAKLRDGTVLIAGGYDNTSSIALADVYHPATGTFAATGAMLSPREGATATTLLDGKVLVTGGSSLPSAEVYDPSSGTFSATGNMSVPRSGHAAVLLRDGTVLVVGGGSADLYDPAKGTFIPAGVMASSRTHATATLLDDGSVLVTGGSDGSGSLASAEIWRTSP